MLPYCGRRIIPEKVQEIAPTAYMIKNNKGCYSINAKSNQKKRKKERKNQSLYTNIFQLGTFCPPGAHLAMSLGASVVVTTGGGLLLASRA